MKRAKSTNEHWEDLALAICGQAIEDLIYGYKQSLKNIGYIVTDPSNEDVPLRHKGFEWQKNIVECNEFIGSDWWNTLSNGLDGAKVKRMCIVEAYERYAEGKVVKGGKYK